MTMLLRLVLIPSFGLALLSACDPRAEEETSLSPVDLSASEIIQRVRNSEASISSVREDRTDISTQLAAPMGDVNPTPEETRRVRIQVGEYVYLKDVYVDTEACEGDPDCGDPFSPFDESLYYHGSTYQRDGSGSWVIEPEPGCPDAETYACFGQRLAIEHSVEVGTGGFVDTVADCPALASIAPPERSPIYSFEFTWITNPERVDTGSGDTDLIHIRGIIDEPFWSLGLTPEIEAIYAECGIDPAEAFQVPEIPEPFSDYFPERFTGAADIWVDPETFFLHRVEWSLDSLNGDRLIQRETTTAAYSLFNEADLPGPLPD